PNLKNIHLINSIIKGPAGSLGFLRIIHETLLNKKEGNDPQSDTGPGVPGMLPKLYADYVEAISQGREWEFLVSVVPRREEEWRTIRPGKRRPINEFLSPHQEAILNLATRRM